jgi:hypothetical protein
MRKMLLCAVASMFCLLVGTASAVADPMGDVSGYLHFKLTHDTAMIVGTQADTMAEIAVDTFFLELTDPAHATDSIVSFKAELRFDSTKLRFLSAAATNWNGSFDSTLTADGTYKKIQLLFWGGKTLATSYQPYAIIKFKVKCQNENAVDSVLFTKTIATNEVNLASYAQLNPCDTCYHGGAVSAGDYYATFSLLNDTLTNAVGTKVGVPLRANTSFRTYVMTQVFTHDPNRLHFDSVQSTHTYAWGPNADVSGDTISVLTYPWGGPWSQYNDTVIYVLWFTVLCGSPHTNAATRINFVADSCYIGFSNCNSGVVPIYNNGTLWFDDFASYSAQYVSGTAGLSSSTIKYRILAANTYPAGIKARPQVDTGMVVNVNFGTAALGFAGTATDSTDGLRFEKATEGNLGQLWQKDTLTLFRGVNATPSRLLIMNLLWDPSSYTPSWANRKIVPSFVKSIGANHPIAKVPDTIPCITAIPQAAGDSVPLILGTFDTLTVRLAELATVGNASNNACTWFDLKVRSTCPVDSLKFTVTVSASWCINGVSNLLTGVIDSCIDLQTVKFMTTQNLSTISASDGYTTLARVSVGLHNVSCPMKATTVGCYPTISADSVWSATGQRELLAKSIGGASGRCSPPSSNCCSGCSIGQDEQIDPGGPLPRSTDGLPREFALDQNYPNPFNPITTISLDLPKASDWTITVFNITGQVVKAYSGYSGPGRVQVEFDGSQVASGVYLYRAEAGEFAATKKMVLMK